MLNRLIAILTAVVLFMYTGSAFAAITDLELIRVIYERTTGTTEQLTDLGPVSTLLTGTTTKAGDPLTANTPSNLWVSYFAVNRTTGELWVSGSTDTTKAPVAVGTPGFTTLKSGLTNLYSNYATIAADANGVQTGSQTTINGSFRNKLDASQGALSNAINIATRVNTEANLAALLNGTVTSVTQLLYHFTNANTAGSAGSPVATITTNADGSTSISDQVADTTPPVVTINTPPPATSNIATVSIAFSATDNVAVTGYLLTESATPPGAADSGWSASAQTSYTFVNIPVGTTTTKSLYAWAKDAAGNVSAPVFTSVDITIPGITTPTITWATPSAISYGTAISTTQLNATASVPGSFTYTPASGAVLNAGTQTITASFTPTDAVNYTTATTSVNLVVNPASLTITASSASKVYGQTVGFTGSEFSASGLQNGETIGSVTLTSTGSAANAGVSGSPYTITPSSPTGGTFNPANYSIIYAPGNLTVSKALLNVAGHDQVKTINTPNPPLTYAITGFVNGETSAVLSGTPDLSTTAVTGSLAGTYPIMVALGTLTATNYSFNFINGTLTVTGKALPTITWPAPAAITYGTPLSATQLNATASVQGTFTYTPSLGSVLNAGIQNLSATFTPTDSTAYASVTSNVPLTINKAVLAVSANDLSRMANSTNPVLTYTTTGFVNGETSAVLSGAPALSTTAVTASPAGSYPINIATATLSATNYSLTFANGTLTVIPQSVPTINWATPAAIIYGTALSTTQLNATASVPGTFAYTPALGNVPVVGTQTLSVTFTPTDSVNYSTATTTVNLVVGKGAATITWPAPAAITYDTPLSATQLNATSSVPGTYTYAPASGSILNAGTQNLSVTFTPTDSTTYASVTANVSLMVNKATPTVTWKAPASIDTITPLSATQLNATAGMAGSFAYTPAVDSLLPAGSQKLSVTFTPADSVNYSTATASVNLQVNPWYPNGALSGSKTPTINDALKVLQASVGLITLTPAEQKNVDVAPLVNGKPQPNGKIDLGDVLVILERAVGSIPAW